MDSEGAGAHSPFAPSSAQTNTGKTIPSNFFMDSAGCGRLPQGTFTSSGKAPRIISLRSTTSSTRKSIEYMQDVAGTRPQQVVRGLP